MSTNGTSLSKTELHDLKLQAAGRANASPFPGPLKEAFVDGDIQVGQYKVRKVVAFDWIVFEAINSPLLELVKSARQNPKEAAQADISMKDQCAICWQFTRSADEVDEVLQKGVDEVHRRVKEDFAKRASMSDIALLTDAVVKQIQTMWATAQGHSANGQGDTTFFPEREIIPKTVPAGS